MRTNRYTALIDACVLVGALTRNMVLSLAEAGYFRPRWSQQILDETERAIRDVLVVKGAANPDESARRSCAAITRAFPESAVDGYSALIPAFDLPDPNDRHVLAAAIQTRAAVIVTGNVKHFPSEYLEGLDLKASTADEFLSDVIDLYTPGAVAALRTMRQRFKRPEMDAETLLRRMEAAGLTETVNLLIREVDFL
jgi:predicted nucleic acid-binding protein